MVESVIAQVGEGTSDPNAGPSMAQTPNKAKITVQFHPFAERLDTEGNRVNSADVLNKIRATLSNYPGVVVSVAKDNNGPPTGPPVNIEIAGDDYFELVQTADEIRTFINAKGIAGIEELKLDVETGKPEMPIEVDRIKARALGLSSAQIGDAMRTALFGKSKPIQRRRGHCNQPSYDGRVPLQCGRFDESKNHLPRPSDRPHQASAYLRSSQGEENFDLLFSEAY